MVTNPKNSSASPEGTPRRGHGRTTLADVAQQAGVTTMTVSRYLRAPQLLAPGTAKKVALALLKTGYQPNKQAGMLASGRSQIVACIVPNIAHSIFAETIQGLSDHLQSQSLELLLGSSNYSLEREEEQIAAVLGWAPAALVVTGRRHSPGALALMRSAKASGTPVVEMWDWDANEHEFAQIGFSHWAVGQAMAQHLLERQLTDLVYVDSGVPEDFRAHERGQGFLQAAAHAGAQARVHVAPLDEPMQAGRQALRDLRESGLPRAIAFANDQLCAGAYLQANELQINVPDTLALLGFGDFAISRQLGGGLSTVRVESYAIGQACAQNVLAALRPGLGTAKPADRASAHNALQPVLQARRST